MVVMLNHFYFHYFVVLFVTQNDYIQLLAKGVLKSMIILMIIKSTYTYVLVCFFLLGTPFLLVNSADIPTQPSRTIKFMKYSMILYCVI